MQDAVAYPRPQTPVAMVTGGNRGIGRGITEELLRHGYAVSLLATRPEPAETLQELRSLPDGSGQVAYTRGSIDDLDVGPRYLAATLEAFGRIDLLVNNAGVAPKVRADLLQADPASFDRVLGVNLRGPYFLTQVVAREMIAQRDRDLSSAGIDLSNGLPALDRPAATIINVSSISADTVSTNRGEYCVSKAGVHMATLLYAARLAGEGIVVYEVRPGVIATDMTAGVKDRYDALFAAGIAPMPRWGRPDDVGRTVAMLASGSAPYSTGDVIHVDGGMHIPRL
ncbi:3-ketoacyl-ACP reductase [Actinomyces sp. Z5]|uniref:Short-chain dehydrogenase/reductase sdr n=1 Tax=Actinomyces glycerinitolerans TaxID=1892869 RepID=A0A1M4S3J0_9ACTO|nr:MULTISPECIES: 3-ketoacyl-ACP reductase [Actinomyces]RAX20069.1 3-ketoacyl-ACP reductase [Actinomyces sp. Z5]SHE26729.1 short-chain dehydrogenase/reductase sdr [Actinomyces glycerinitolerans]